MRPCRERCLYTIILTVTQRVKTQNLDPRVENKKIPLVSGFAVVGDATGDVDPSKSTAQNKKATQACQQMIWVPDSFVRDALAEVRFKIGQEALRL